MRIVASRQFRTLSVLMLLLLGGVMGSRAAFDAYLRLEGVDGESTDPQHAKWIIVTSFAQGILGTNASISQRQFSELCLAKRLDASSPTLALRCAEGAVIPSARLELITTSADRLKFYEITLSNVVVTSVSTSGNSAGAGSDVTEQVCLAFNRIEWIYTEYHARALPLSTISVWWDLVLNIGDSNVAPILRVAGAQVGANQFRLSWPARAGKTYRILGSPQINDPYRLIDSVVAEANGPLIRTLSMGGSQRFFRIEEAP